MATELPAILRVEHLAPLLGLSEHGVRAMLRRGELPASRLGRHWIVRRDALLAHLERGERRRAACQLGDVGDAVERVVRNLPSRRGPSAETHWTE